MTDPVTLYGMKISMFTGKVRSYLIKQRIPFNEIAPVTEHFQSVICLKLDGVSFLSLKHRTEP